MSGNTWHASIRFRGFIDGRCDLIGALVRSDTGTVLDFHDANKPTRDAVIRAVRDWLETVDP